MKIVYVDGEKITSRPEFYDTFRDALPGAELYGDNLDALRDALSALSYPVGVILTNTQNIRSFFGLKFASLMRLFGDLTEENENVRVLVDPFEDDPELFESL